MISVSVRQEVLAAGGYKCFYCGVDLTSPKHIPTIDHKIPQVDGGSDARDNLVGACKSCNSRKGSQPIDLYRTNAWMDMPVRKGWSLLLDAMTEIGKMYPDEIPTDVDVLFTSALQWFQQKALEYPQSPNKFRFAGEGSNTITASRSEALQ